MFTSLRSIGGLISKELIRPSYLPLSLVPTTFEPLGADVGP